MQMAQMAILFGANDWECDDLESTMRILKDSRVNEKWQESMKGIITGRDDIIPSPYEEVFHMD